MTSATRGIAAVLFLAACGGRAAEEAAEPPAPENAELTVEVENHHSLDMVVYVLYGGISSRVGTVSGIRTTYLSIPWRRLAGRRDIRLQAHPIGDVNALLTTERIHVRPGTVIHWMIETGLVRSSISVYGP